MHITIRLYWHAGPTSWDAKFAQRQRCTLHSHWSKWYSTGLEPYQSSSILSFGVTVERLAQLFLCSPPTHANTSWVFRRSGPVTITWCVPATNRSQRRNVIVGIVGCASVPYCTAMHGLCSDSAKSSAGPKVATLAVGDAVGQDVLREAQNS